MYPFVHTQPQVDGPNYVVRIIPPDNKRDAKTYEWHNVHETFRSPDQLKTMLVDTFTDKLPDNGDFQIGYFTKKGNSKRWIEGEADLVSMYKHCAGSEHITLFCDGKSTPHQPTQENSRKRKRTTDCTDHEEEVRQLASVLQDKHGAKWNKRQYLIWARMNVNKQYHSLVEPPDIPLITNGVKKVSRKETFSEAIHGAAVAFANTLKDKNDQDKNDQPDRVSAFPSGVSPASKARLSREYILQLKELQSLRECGVLSEEEFQEQKKFALDSLRGMNK